MIRRYGIKAIVLALIGSALGFMGAGASSEVHAAEPIKVATVGDSITAGAGVSDPSTQSYPARLQRMLGADYKVRNFGVSGTTMLTNGDSPYVNTQNYVDSSNWNPDIVVIQLGTNDTKSWNWQPYGDEFLSDAEAMIEHYRDLPSHPAVYLNLSPFIYPNSYGIDSSVMQNEVLAKQLQAASELAPAVPVINVNAATMNLLSYFPDGVHPNERGAAVIAETVRNAIAPSSSPPASMLDRTGWTAAASASASDEGPNRALDGLLATRWTSGIAETGGMWFSVDMQAPRTFNQIVLDDTDLSSNDFPLQYELYASNDGTSWQLASSGTGSLTSTTISLPAVTARYVKIVETANGASWWSIHDFRVYLTNPPIGKTIWLKSNANGKYVSAREDQPNAPLEAVADQAAGWEHFKVVDAGGGYVALQSLANNNYVTAWQDAANAPLWAQAATIQDWEKLAWVDQGGGNVSLRAYNNGSYVGADLNEASDPLVAWTSSASTWEYFTWGEATSEVNLLAKMTATIPASDAYVQITIGNVNVTNGQCSITFYSNANAGNWINVDDVEFYKQ